MKTRQEFYKEIFQGSPYLPGSGLRSQLERALNRMSLISLDQLLIVINTRNTIRG